MVVVMEFVLDGEKVVEKATKKVAGTGAIPQAANSVS